MWNSLCPKVQAKMSIICSWDHSNFEKPTLLTIDNFTLYTFSYVHFHILLSWILLNTHLQPAINFQDFLPIFQGLSATESIVAKLSPSPSSSRAELVIVSQKPATQPPTHPPRKVWNSNSRWKCIKYKLLLYMR